MVNVPGRLQRRFFPGRHASAGDELWVGDVSQRMLVHASAGGAWQPIRWGQGTPWTRSAAALYLDADVSGCWITGAGEEGTVHTSPSGVVERLTNGRNFKTGRTALLDDALVVTAWPSPDGSFPPSPIEVIGREGLRASVSVPGQPWGAARVGDEAVIGIVSAPPSGTPAEYRMVRVSARGELAVGPLLEHDRQPRFAMLGGTRGLVYDRSSSRLRTVQPDLSLDGGVSAPELPVTRGNGAWESRGRVFQCSWRAPLQFGVTADRWTLLEINPRSGDVLGNLVLPLMPLRVVCTADGMVWVRLWTPERRLPEPALVRWDPAAGSTAQEIRIDEQLPGDATLPVTPETDAVTLEQRLATITAAIAAETRYAASVRGVVLMRSWTAGDFPDTYLALEVHPDDDADLRVAFAINLFTYDGTLERAPGRIASDYLQHGFPHDWKTQARLRLPDREGVTWLRPPRPIQS